MSDSEYWRAVCMYVYVVRTHTHTHTAVLHPFTSLEELLLTPAEVKHFLVLRD